MAEGFHTEDKYFKTIEKKLAEELDKKRFVHTIGVAYTAVSLAMAHGESLYDAYLAGLLHDNAKCMSIKDKRRMCKKYGIALNEAEEKNPELLHAGLGAVLAREKFHVKDRQVLDAIRYHTTGRPEMSELEKIIYIADYIEPNRRHLSGLEEVRRSAFANLNQTMLIILENTLSYLRDSGACIDEMTQKTYDYYVSLNQRRTGISNKERIGV